MIWVTEAQFAQFMVWLPLIYQEIQVMWYFRQRCKFGYDVKKLHLGNCMKGSTIVEAPTACDIECLCKLAQVL